MGRRTSHPPGAFSWVDLATSDLEGAKRFYTDLFGWEYEDMPIDQGVYSMANLGGDNVAALSEQRDVSPHWNNYVTVEDADAAAAKAGELGAEVLFEPFDVFDSGRMAVLQDPAGAIFQIWQPRQSIGAERVNEPGCLTWNDLTTPDPDGAQEFYAGLFGWRAESVGVPGVDYRIWWNGDRTNGGMLTLSDEMRTAGVPPNWMPYLAVASVDDTIGKAESAGGELMTGPTEVPKGSFAVLRDPQGAFFALSESEFDD